MWPLSLNTVSLSFLTFCFLLMSIRRHSRLTSPRSWSNTVKDSFPFISLHQLSVCSYLKNLDLLSKLLCRAKLFHKKCIQPRGLNTEHTNIFYQSENQYNKYKTVNVSLRNLLKLAMSLNTVEEGFKQYYHLKHNNIQRGWCGLRWIIYLLQASPLHWLIFCNFSHSLQTDKSICT